LWILMCGYTGNEESKWTNIALAISDRVAFAVKMPDGSEMIQTVELEDQETDTREKRMVESLAELDNIYDQGVRQNLRLVWFGRQMQKQ
ncbi:hypothetical protein FBU59_006790, partial [Linderina macrospora]